MNENNAPLRIEQTQCLNLRGRHVSCTQCADTCPAKALVLTADEVRLDAGRCSACGACLPVCPSGALWLSGFDPQQFLQTVAGQVEIHIHCSQSDHPDAGNGVNNGTNNGTDNGINNSVPCHQVLDARLLVAAAAEGVQTVVLHGIDQCSSCARGDARAVVEKMHADLEKWFTDVPVQLLQEHRAQTGAGGRLAGEQVQLSRRNFLRLGGAHVAQGAAAWFADVAAEQDEATPRWPPASSDGRSRHPSAYQELLAERAELLPWREGELPWRSRVIGDACNACLACVQCCPTGSLVAEETTSTISIFFQLRLCTDCGLCEHQCPEIAISSTPAARVEELRAQPYRVMHRSLRQCTGCSRSFVPGADSVELCTACQNEKDVENDWVATLSESS